MHKQIIANDFARDKLIEFIRALDLTKPWVFEWKRPTNKRSLNQNSLLHKWFGEIAAETSNHAKSVKEDYIAEFSPMVAKSVGDGMRPKRTHEHTTQEAAEFMDRVYAHATTYLGMYLTNPDELGRR